MTLAAHIRGLWHRAQFYADVPTVLLLLKFRELRESYYREVWQAAATDVGATIAEWGGGFLAITRGGLTTVVKLSSVMLDDHLTVQVVSDKTITSTLLTTLGAPVPNYAAYDMQHLDIAKGFLDRRRGRCVVKPASGTGAGRGVTTGIADLSQLKRASRHAARFARPLMIEEEIEGGTYRLLYLDGKLIDAVRRDPPTVTGDGRSTIRQLIAAENRRRLQQRPFTALSPIRIDRDCLGTLAAQDLAPGRRPAAGRVITVKKVPNENAAWDNHSVKTGVHPETVALGARLVSALGMRFAGLDLICRDIGKPLSRDNGRVNEINATPGIHHHTLVADPARGVPVAALVLEHLFNRRQGVLMLNPPAPAALALAG